MAGLQQYSAYRAMMTLFRSLWFLDDALNECIKATGKEPKDFTLKDFGKWFFDLEESERRKWFLFAVLFGAELNPDELLPLLMDARDKNGVPITKSNIGNMKMSEIANAAADKCLELSQERIFF